MKQICFSCGVEKDTEVLEMYPYDGDNDTVTIDEPVPPLFVLDCEPEAIDKPWKVAVVCHNCLHKLEADLWICEDNWKRLNPVTPFDKLPNVLENGTIDRRDPERYKCLQ